ncbi:conserved hypothetical protein [Ricinus communis]|uniref:Uncharacterized protein n=1 Tax=Ricinus communis TaxID=3988 RepID=B9SKP4_RICCO|nr:conserved hypothetical protein [Ricinus communis]
MQLLTPLQRLGIKKLNGVIPDEIRHLSKLEMLELHESEFYGPLPFSTRNLRMLHNLKS